VARLNSFARNLGRVVMNYAARVLPRALREWNEEMASEFEAIENDWAALDWAVGCVLAAYYAKISRRDRIGGPVARGLIRPPIRRAKFLITVLALAYVFSLLGFLIDSTVPRWIWIGIFMIEVVFYFAVQNLKRLKRKP
jgi:hypothetical protein